MFSPGNTQAVTAVFSQQLKLIAEPKTPQDRFGMTELGHTAFGRLRQQQFVIKQNIQSRLVGGDWNHGIL